MADENTLLSSMTGDGAEALAVDKVVGEGNGITCFSHTLQLVVRAGFDSDGFQESIKRVRNLIKFVLARRPVLEHVLVIKRSQMRSQRARHE